MRFQRLLLVLLMVGVSACKSDKGGKSEKTEDTAKPAPPDEPKQPEQSPMVKAQLKLADEICACSDAACAQKVVEDNMETLKRMQGYQPSSTEEGNALMEATKRWSDCANKIPTP